MAQIDFMTTPEQKLEFVILQILRGVVTCPEQATVHVDRAHRTATLIMGVADIDVSRAIGKGGVTFKAIRLIAEAIAQRDGLQVYTERIPEPRTQSVGDRPRKALDLAAVGDMVLAVGGAMFRFDTVLSVDRKIITNGWRLTLHVARSEAHEAIGVFHKNMSVIVAAIGSMDGKTLVLDVVEDQNPDQQPDRADGAHVRE